MDTRIVKDKIRREELQDLARKQYGDFIKAVSEERWQRFSLAEQLGNIGSEVGRAAKWQVRSN